MAMHNAMKITGPHRLVIQRAIDQPPKDANKSAGAIPSMADTPLFHRR
jgi:hypothetical protein